MPRWPWPIGWSFRPPPDPAPPTSFRPAPDQGSARSASPWEDLDRLTLRLLAVGLTDRAVARQLNLSQRTVQRHVATLMTRLGARTRLQAGVQGIRQGWL